MPRSPRKTPIKKRPTTKKKQTHPTYKDMITEAILEDKQWTKGSSRQTIGKYIVSNYGIDEAMVRQRLGNTIRRLTEEDEGPVLIKNVGCYKLNPDWKKDWLKKKNKRTSTSSTSSPRKKRKKTMKKRSYRKKKDKNAPKKGKTAYIFYSSSIRDAIKNKYPDATFGDISKKCAAKWKKLPDSKREKFKTLAEADKKRYEREMKSYRKRKRDSSSTSGSTSSSTSSSSTSSSSSSSEEPSSSSESSEEKKRKKRKSLSEKSEKEKSEKAEKEKAEKEKAEKGKEKEKEKEKAKTDLRKLESKKKSSSTSE